MLNQLDDDYADRVLPRSAWVKQTKRLRDRIEERQKRLATLHNASALDYLGGDVVARWDGLTAEEKRVVIGSLVSSILVERVREPGGNKFDPNRVHILWQWESVARAFEGYHPTDAEIERVLAGTDEPMVPSKGGIPPVVG